MFSNNYRKIYFYHLKKCGGTSFNRWLSRHVDDYRVWSDELFFKGLTDNWGFYPEKSQTVSGAFYACDAIYTHVPMRHYAPEGTLSVTVLREPIARIASQIADWRRDVNTKHTQAPDDIRALMEDAASLSLRNFLIRHGRGDRGYLFDNYETRALSRRFPNRDVAPHVNAEDLLTDALYSLENDYDIVGVQEQSRLLRLAVACTAGLPYEDGEGEHLNVTQSGKNMREEVEEAKDILSELTSADVLLYEKSKDIFFGRHAEEAEKYSEVEFERKYINSALLRLHPVFDNGSYVFSVRDPLIASGIHGRDASGSENCTVWSGPSNRMVVYMPAPSNSRIAVKFWIRGLADPKILDGLMIEIDDHLVQHDVIASSGWAAILQMETFTRRDYVKVAITVKETVPTPSGTIHQDLRKRGIAFSQYGWQLI